MRIVTELLALSRLGGVEVTVLEDVRALSLRGHDVHVVFGPSPGGYDDLREDLEDAGAVLHGPLQTRWTPKRTPVDLVAYVPSARLLSRLRPDVLWVNRFEHLVWAHAARCRSRTPVVSHLHNAPAYRPPVQRVLATGVAEFVAVSEFTRDQWVAHGLNRSRTAVLYNAVPPQAYPLGGEPERLAARAALGIPPQAHVVLMYGSMVPEKGLNTLVEAWARIEAAEPTSHLLLAGLPLATDGDAPQAEALRRSVEHGRARVLGQRRDVVPLLHAADVVVFPSLLPEAFGRVVLEALVTGRPVVSSRVGAVPEILTDGLASMLVEPGDPDALAKTTLDVLRWRDREPGRGAGWSHAVTARFDHGTRIDALEVILERAAGGRRPSRLAQEA